MMAFSANTQAAQGNKHSGERCSSPALAPGRQLSSFTSGPFSETLWGWVAIPYSIYAMDT